MTGVNSSEEESKDIDRVGYKIASPVRERAEWEVNFQDNLYYLDQAWFLYGGWRCNTSYNMYEWMFNGYWNLLGQLSAATHDKDAFGLLKDVKQELNKIGKNKWFERIEYLRGVLYHNAYGRNLILREYNEPEEDVESKEILESLWTEIKVRYDQRVKENDE